MGKLSSPEIEREEEKESVWKCRERKFVWVSEAVRSFIRTATSFAAN